MKKVFFWIAGVLCLSLFALFLYSTLRSGVRASVRNSDVRPMKNVVVKTSAGSYPLGNIAPRSTKSVRVDGGGGSSIDVAYTDSSGKPQHLAVDSYFESGFHGTIDVEVKSGKIASVKDNVAP